MKWTCAGFTALHLAVLAVCTYVAAYEIRTILFTGLLCSGTALVAAVLAVFCGRFVLAGAALATPLIAIILFVLEVFFLNLGPHQAAAPFCIVFLLNQIVSTTTMLVEINLLTRPEGAKAWQVTLRTLLAAMVGFALFFGLARYLSELGHDWIMTLALGLAGITCVGLATMFYATFARGAGSFAALCAPKKLWIL
jgi:hypothetical protein